MLARRNLYVLLSNRCPKAGQMLQIWGGEGLEGCQGRVIDKWVEGDVVRFDIDRRFDV